MNALALKDVLEGIDARTIPLEIIEAPTFCGLPKYLAAGWTFCVFDDCDEWDYLEWVESPDGRRIEFVVDRDFVSFSEEEKLVNSYSPEHEEDWGYK